MIEVKNGAVHLKGSSVGILAEYSRLTNSLLELDSIDKEDIKHAVEVGLMTEEERKEEVEKLEAELTQMIAEKIGCNCKETEDKQDDEIKQAIDMIVQKFMENM